PASAVHNGNNTIQLPNGHGLVTGDAVIYRKAAGPEVLVRASGHDTNFARSEAGSGGLVAGSAAKSQTDTESTTKAYIADDTAARGQTTLDVATLNVEALPTSSFDAQTDTVQA